MDGRFSDANLESVEFGRIMASRNHNSSVPVQMKKGKVKYRGRAEAYIYYIQSSGNHAFNQGFTEPGGTEATVHPYDDRISSESRKTGGNSLAEKVHHFIRQIDINQTANIVLSKNPGVHEDPFKKIQSIQ
jgi:hypothetical protein